MNHINMHNLFLSLGTVLLMVLSLLSNTTTEPFDMEMNYAYFLLGISTLAITNRLIQGKCNDSLSLLDVSLFIFGIYILIRLCIDDCRYWEPADTCKWATAILLYIFVRNIRHKRGILFGIVCLGLLESVTAIFQYMGLSESGHSYFLITGHLNNPGLLGGYLAVCLIISLKFLLYSHTRKILLLYIPITLLLAIGMILSESRAAWLSISVGLLMFIPSVTFRKWKMVLVGLFLVSVIGIGLYLYRPFSADGRLLIWKVTAGMIADKPLLGHGIGAFPYRYMHYQADYFEKTQNPKEMMLADNVSCVYNEPLHLMADAGFIGFLLLVFTLILIIKKGKVLEAKAGLLVWGVFSFFSYPSLSFPLLLLPFLLLGCLEIPACIKFSSQTLRFILTGCFILSFIYGYKQHSLYDNIQRIRTAFIEKQDTTNAQTVLTYYPSLKGSMTYHLTSLLPAMKVLNDTLQQHLFNQIIPNTETYIQLGKYYQNSGKSEKAEHIFIETSRMVPNRLMPFYNLWKLYLQQEDTTKAMKVAETLLARPVKIANSFTFNAKKEVRTFVWNYRLNKSLNQAGDNRKALEYVLQYYDTTENNEVKKKIAVYLLMNMTDHRSYNDNLLDTYADLLRECPDNTPKDSIYDIWNYCKNKYPLPFVSSNKDLQTLDAEYLIDNIEYSYQAWKHAPWSKDISFDIYCKYILPYRVGTERLSAIGWRDTLFNKYYPLIKGEKSVKKAFAIINRHITHHFRNTQPFYPREMDALSIGKVRPGNCSLRCLYTVYVLRSLGIPACYDFVNHWSNYSTRGHSWVALVTHPDSTFTLHKGDSLPSYNNRIDGSVFMADFLPEKEYPYPLDSIKKVAQIFRQTFEMQHNEHCHEATSLYGISKSLKITDAPVKEGFCDVSIFLTGKDWEIIKSVPISKHKLEVAEIGYNQLYLLTFKDETGYEIESVPIIFHSDGSLEYLRGDKKKMEKVVAYRKYPLFIHQTETWCKMKGCIVEASDSPDFIPAETLMTVEKTPFGFYSHKVNPTKPYRYVRYKNTNVWSTALAEFEVYGDTKLKGTPIGSTAEKEQLSKGVDGNYITFVTSHGKDYWFGLDLGINPQLIKEIRILPKNDANFIEPGHLYETFYYDNRWVSLDVQTAGCDSLELEIPTGSLALIRDLTAGKEERPFTYRKHTPKWW